MKHGRLNELLGSSAISREHDRGPQALSVGPILFSGGRFFERYPLRISPRDSEEALSLSSTRDAIELMCYFQMHIVQLVRPTKASR